MYINRRRVQKKEPCLTSPLTLTADRSLRGYAAVKNMRTRPHHSVSSVLLKRRSKPLQTRKSTSLPLAKRLGCSVKLRDWDSSSAHAPRADHCPGPA